MIDRATISDLIIDIRCSERWGQDMSQSDEYRKEQLDYAKKCREDLSIWFKNRHKDNVLDSYGYPKGVIMTFQQFKDEVMNTLEDIISFSFNDLSGLDYNLYTFETGIMGISGRLDHKGEWSVYSPVLDTLFISGSLEGAIEQIRLECD